MVPVQLFVVVALLLFVQTHGTVVGAELAPGVAAEEQQPEKLHISTLWHAFLEVNPAAEHAIASSLELFATRVKSKTIPFEEQHIFPSTKSWKVGLEKFTGYMHTGATSKAKRSLVVYHIDGAPTSLNTISVATNNLKLFISSIYQHQNSSKQAAFYLFNAMDGDDEAQKLVPTHLPNVALVRWAYSPHYMFSFLHTLKLLDTDAITSVDAVLSLSTAVRGPLEHTQDGQWIGKFGELLDSNGVGLVGSMINCEGSPHVQTHAFAVKSSLVPQLLLELERYYLSVTHTPMQDYFRTLLTRAVQESNFLISSLYHATLPSGTGHFQASSCNRVKADFNSSTACAPQPTGVIFQRWSGDSLGAQGYICGKASAMNPQTQAQMQELTLSLMKQANRTGRVLPEILRPVFPESLIGGALYELYAEYALEAHRLQNPQKSPSASLLAAKKDRVAGGDVDDFVDTSKPVAVTAQVCFLVRTAAMHDPRTAAASATAGKIKYVEMDLDVLARSLLMQTNGNWQAFFIITDPSPFEARLQEILAAYNDPRLSYFHVDLRYRPKFTVVDAGYTTTDYVLNELLARKECKWVSATNGDNAYGSEVVERILSAAHAQGSTRQPDMLLLPMDSRNFADQDYILRDDRTWDRRCVGVEATSALFQLASTAGSMPKVSRVDLAAIVLNREKLLAEDVRFSNFSDPAKYRCLGCNDGYFAQYLVRSSSWTYTRLPVDGLRSLMFHGPSPTHCIAAGNVWFDHPLVGKVGCLSQETVRKILLKDARRDKRQRLFDSKHFSQGDKICLRLNKFGHQSKSPIVSTQRRLASVPESERLNKYKHNAESPVTAQRSLLAIPGDDRRRAPVLAQRSLLAIPESELSDDPRIFSKRHIRFEKASDDCDWSIYLRLNPDLVANNITLETAAEHFFRTGKAELRVCNFYWKYYLSANPDLIDAGITTPELALQHYACCGMPEGRIHRTYDGFDWIAYLEVNSDLHGKPVKTKYDALTHFRNSGRAEFRPVVPSAPSASSLSAAIQKFSAYWASCVGCAGKRNLIIYHVEDLGFIDDAFLLTVNNVKVFLVALMQQVLASSGASGDQKAFYWFNVAGLMENPMRRFIPANLPNVALVDWTLASSPFFSFVQTMRQFDSKMLASVDAIFSSSSEVRGPLYQVEGGAWIGEFRRLLDKNNVGVVGPVVSCEGDAHVPNHVFAVRSAVIPMIIAELVPYNDIDVFVSIQEYFVKRLAGVAFEAGMKIASLVHSKLLKTDFVDNATCVDPCTVSTEKVCRVQPAQALFLPWSGELWKGVAMDKQARENVGALTKALGTAALRLLGDKLPSAMVPVLPESPSGWLIYEEFNTELGLLPNPADSTALPQVDSQVCFLVSVRKSHDRAASASTGIYEARTVQDLLRDLSVQTVRLWKAFLYTDDSSFESRVGEIAHEAKDLRVSFLSLNGTTGKRLDAGLKRLLQHKECRWLSYTEGDKAYGSEVVERVFTPSPQTDPTRQPDMLLLPMDSVAYEQHDNRRRGASSWKDQCVGINTMVSLYQLSYTVQPVPEPGRVFAPSLFLNRGKLATAGILPGASTMPKAYLCPSCDAGYFAKLLVRRRGWTYARLPMDGLRSIVFDYPSPSHCIAAGNVWFDHVCAEKAGCVTYASVRRLRTSDEVRNVTYFDWDGFYKSDQICLRFSESGYKSQKCRATILL